MRTHIQWGWYNPDNRGYWRVILSINSPNNIMQRARRTQRHLRVFFVSSVLVDWTCCLGRRDWNIYFFYWTRRLVAAKYAICAIFRPTFLTDRREVILASFLIFTYFFILAIFVPQSGQLEKHGENQRKQKKTCFFLFLFCLLPAGQWEKFLTVFLICTFVQN